VSREVIGDAPAGLQVAAPSPAAASTPRVSAPPQEPAPRGRRFLPAVAAATAMLVLVTGWTAYRLTSPPGDPARGVVAVVTGVTAAAASTAQPTRRALLSITIANPGTDIVSVAGYAYTSRSSSAVGLDEPNAHVSPGERVELSVDVALECARAAPLLLPDLVIEESDGGRRQIPVVGAVAALTGICAAGPPQGQPLIVTGTRRDGDTLVVRIAAPSNRHTVVRTVRAIGVVVDAGELPLRVDRVGQELRLTPPAGCPRPWRQDGVPHYLDVELDTVGPSIALLEVGKPLATWVLDVVCRDVP
jgi:hypothetical protein